jgi:hypothetical protein
MKQTFNDTASTLGWNIVACRGEADVQVGSVATAYEEAAPNIQRWYFIGWGYISIMSSILYTLICTGRSRVCYQLLNVGHTEGGGYRY